ncbi:MAG: hypothetical protein GY856_31860 [bacterium]|nr:hypothetical protein [bacterium]
MSETTADFRGSFATLVEATREQSATHPDLDRWMAYRGGKLPAEEQARLQRHLAGCRECVALVLDLEAFSRPEESDRAGISEFEVAAAWRAVRSAISADVRTERRWHVPTTLAASLLVAALGLSTWLAVEHRTATELRRRVAELSQPQINVPIEDLWPDTATRGGLQPAVEVLTAARSFTLLLNLPEPREFPDYQVEILDSEGTEIWSSTGLEVSSFGNFTLGIPRGFLPAGEYGVRICGLDGERNVPLQDYAVQIR